MSNKISTIKTKAEIQIEIEKLHLELRSIQDREYKEKQIPFVLKQVGTCHIFKNNGYGGDSPKWDVYKRIIDSVMTKNGSIKIIVEEFSINCYKHCQYEIKNDFIVNGFNEEYLWSGFQKIPLKQYIKQRTIFFKELDTRAQLKKHLKNEE